MQFKYLKFLLILMSLNWSVSFAFGQAGNNPGVVSDGSPLPVFYFKPNTMDFFFIQEGAEKTLNAYAKLHCQQLRHKFIITAHSHEMGTKEYNKKLSEQRADVVYNYLLKQGFIKELLTKIAVGDEKPLVSEKGIKASKTPDKLNQENNIATVVMSLVN